MAWLRAEHAPTPSVRILGVTDNLPVDFDDPIAWQGHVALMGAAIAADLITSGGPAEQAAVGVVYSCQSYGIELAARFGAQHVLVDPGRREHPVSGTAVRADVPGHWSQLAPVTRAGLSLRVVVLGAESTRITTV